MFYNFLVETAEPYRLHLFAAVLMLFGFLVWLQIPARISYYIRQNGSVGVPYDAEWVEREAGMWGSLLLSSEIRGRLRIIRFCLQRKVRIRPVFGLFLKTMDAILLLLGVPTCVSGPTIDQKTKTPIWMIICNRRSIVFWECLRVGINPWRDPFGRFRRWRAEESWT